MHAFFWHIKCLVSIFSFAGFPEMCFRKPTYNNALSKTGGQLIGGQYSGQQNCTTAISVTTKLKLPNLQLHKRKYATI